MSLPFFYLFFFLMSPAFFINIFSDPYVSQHMLKYLAMSSHNVFMFYFRTVNVSVPKKTRNNGTLYAYIFVHHAGILPWHDGKQVHVVSPLTTYMVPKPEEINLLTGESATQVRGFSICR